MTIVFRFDSSKLRSQLSILDDWKQAVFMLSCIKTLMPSYVVFNKETNFGDPQILQNSIKLVEGWIENQTSIVEIRKLVNLCEAQGPDTLNYTSNKTSTALDAASSIALALTFVESPKVDYAVEVARLSLDNCDRLAQQDMSFVVAIESVEESINCSEVVQVELHRQQTVIEKLSDIRTTRDNVLKNILQTSTA